MILPTIKEMVSGNKRVHFSFFQDGQLWYKAENGFEFPVPVNDTGNGCFLSEDKALFFMRWMRKHLELMKEKSWTALGRHFEVSDNAVRKWAKSYGLL